MSPGEVRSHTTDQDHGSSSAIRLCQSGSGGDEGGDGANAGLKDPDNARLPSSHPWEYKEKRVLLAVRKYASQCCATAVKGASIPCSAQETRSRLTGWLTHHMGSE